MSTAEQTPPDNVVALSAIAAARQGAEVDKAAHKASALAQADAEKQARREAAAERITATAGQFEAWQHGVRESLPEDPRAVPGWAFGYAKVYGWPKIHVESATSLAEDLPRLFAAASPHLSGVGGSVFAYGGRLVSYLSTGGHLSTDKRLTEVSPDLAAKIAADQAVCYVVVRLDPTAMANPDMIDTVAADPDFLNWEGEPAGGAYRKRVAPGSALFRPYLADPSYPGVRTLRELVRRPAVDWDGRDIVANGYDLASGLLVDVPPDEVHPELPEVIGAEAVRAAAGRLRQLFGSFTWKGDADYANWLATAFTAVGRRAFADTPDRFLPVPGLLVNAGKMDSGKSVLTSVVGNLYGSAKVKYAADADEFSKAVLGAFASHADAKVLVMDNVENGTRLHNATLDRLITEPVVSGRELGKNRILTFPNTMQVIANGNNLTVADDSASRFIVAELVPPTSAQKAAPRAVADMSSEILRPEFQAQVLGLLRVMVLGWVQAGQPEGSAKDIRGTFAEWARKAAGVLDLAGVPGFLDNLDVMADREADPGAEFLAALWSVFGESTFRARDVMPKFRQGAALVASAEMPSVTGFAVGVANEHEREALMSLAETVPRSRNGGEPNAKTLGWALRPLIGKPAPLGDGAEVLLTAHKAGNQQVWTLQRRTA
jgi:hypothetical protein